MEMKHSSWMDRPIQDSDKCIQTDAGELSLSVSCHYKLEALVEHYSRLLNVEFDWPSEALNDKK